MLRAVEMLLRTFHLCGMTVKLWSRFGLGCRTGLFGFASAFFLPRRVPVIEERLKIVRGIASWLQTDSPGIDVSAARRRVRVLNDEETGEFWCYEPGWEFANRKKIKVNRRGTEIEVPDFSYADGSARGDTTKDNPGTFYVIDEVHIFFPSRAWQRTGEDCTFFLSQHGKMKCDVCMVTQHVDQCDKALRRLAQEYMTVRNLSREPVLGFHWEVSFGSTEC